MATKSNCGYPPQGSGDACGSAVFSIEPRGSTITIEFLYISSPAAATFASARCGLAATTTPLFLGPIKVPQRPSRYGRTYSNTTLSTNVISDISRVTIMYRVP